MMMSFNDPFGVLGIAAEGASRGDVKRAYAKKLKTTRPDDDPQAFMALRESYEQALQHIKWAEEDAAYAASAALENMELEGPETESKETEAIEAGGEINTPTQTSNLPPPQTQPADPALAEQITPAPEPQPQPEPTIVDDIMPQIEALITPPVWTKDLSNWTSLLDQGSDGSIDEFQDLSARIRHLVCKAGGMYHDTDEPFKRADWITLDLLVLLDEHFGWADTRNLDYLARSEIDYVFYLLRTIRQERKEQAMRDNWKARQEVEDSSDNMKLFLQILVGLAIVSFYLYRFFGFS